MTRIACIDLLFQWPPDGGARVDLLHNLSHLAKNNEIRLFVPQWDWQISRGYIHDLNAPFSIEILPVSFRSYNRYRLPGQLASRIRKFAPDFIVVGDGWHMKPFVISSLRDIPYFYRFYAYETTCFRAFGIAYRNDERCEHNAIGAGFHEYLTCLSCALKWSLRGHSKLFLHELLASGAILPDYYYRSRKLLSEAKGLIVYNQFMADRLKSVHSNIAIIPGGIDVTRFSDNSTGNSVPEIDDTPAEFLVAGRMDDPLKGFSTVRAAAGILSSHSTSHTIYYTGNATATEKGLQKLGWLSHADMVHQYQKVRATIIPSLWWEPFGVTALESMACGTPVIASDVGGLREIIDSGVNGILVPPGDEKSLAEAITTLANDPLKARTMGLAGQIKVRESYSWPKVTAQFSRFLELES